MAPRGWACLAGLPAQPLLLLRRRRRANVVEMVKLAGLRGHDVRRLSELLMLSSGRNAAGPCHSPCRHGPKPIPHLIRGMSHPLLLGTRVVPTRSVHFALSISKMSCNLSPPLPQELRSWFELERSRRARRPLSAENNLLGCGAHRPPAEVDYPGALRSAQPPPPPPLSVGVPKAAALALHDRARRGPCAPPTLRKPYPAHPSCTLLRSALTSLPSCKIPSHIASSPLASLAGIEAALARPVLCLPTFRVWVGL